MTAMTGQAEATAPAEATLPQARLFAALARFQAELPSISAGEEARIEAEGKRSYKYKYADLADVVEVVEPLLGKHGLAFTAKPTMTETGFWLVYRLVHESGEYDGGLYPLPDPRAVGPQKLGAQVTYARRYVLMAVVGVFPKGEDDDGKAAQDDFPSAGAAFASASPVRPGQQPPPPPPGLDVRKIRDEALNPATTAARIRGLYAECTQWVPSNAGEAGTRRALLDLLAKAGAERAASEEKAARESLDVADAWLASITGAVTEEDVDKVDAEITEVLAPKDDPRLPALRLLAAARRREIKKQQAEKAQAEAAVQPPLDGDAA